FDVALGRRAGPVELDRPEHGRPHLSRQQAGRSLAEFHGMQRGADVGAVERFAPTVTLDVDRPAGSDESGDVGDGVVHPETVRQALEMHRLVEILGTGGVDGDEGNSCRVTRIHRGAPCDLYCLRDGPGRIAGRNAEFGADRTEIDRNTAGADPSSDGHPARLRRRAGPASRRPCVAAAGDAAHPKAYSHPLLSPAVLNSTVPLAASTSSTISPEFSWPLRGGSLNPRSCSPAQVLPASLCTPVCGL